MPLAGEETMLFPSWLLQKNIRIYSFIQIFQ